MNENIGLRALIFTRGHFIGKILSRSLSEGGYNISLITSEGTAANIAIALDSPPINYIFCEKNYCQLGDAVFARMIAGRQSSAKTVFFNMVGNQNICFYTMDFIENVNHPAQAYDVIKGMGTRYFNEFAEKLQPYGFTAKEMEILNLLFRGERNKNIAETVHLSEQGVKYHVSHFLKKFAVFNRRQLQMKLLDITKQKNPN